MNNRNIHKESSLIWSWGAFVLLPLNFFTGILIAQKADFIESLISLSLGFTVLCFAIYPVVRLSVSKSLNYSQAISKYVTIILLRKTLILLVPLINIGWYSIQVAVVVALLKDISVFVHNQPLLVSMLISFLFSSGAYFFGYKWLHYFGAIAMIIFTAAFSFSSFQYKWSLPLGSNTINIGIIWNSTILVIGSWIFSSVTCIMDLTNYVKHPIKAFINVILSLFVADILLILMGFLAAKIFGINSMEKFLNVGGTGVILVSVVLSIWSTNDSNFFSTMRALEAFDVSKLYSFLFVSIISGVFASFGKDQLFDLFGNWLILMGWIGIPLSFFWWYIYTMDNNNTELT